MKFLMLFYCYRLSEVTWLVYILAFAYSHMIGQQLQGYGSHQWFQALHDLGL
jgi:hypothetical protein